MNQINYYLHLLLSNRYSYLILILFSISILDLSSHSVECLELHAPELLKKTIINNMERMLSDCETKTSIHYKIISEQEIQLHQHKSQMASTLKELDIANKALGVSAIIIVLLLAKIAFSK